LWLQVRLWLYMYMMWELWSDLLWLRLLLLLLISLHLLYY
jgi:hypothetical protein